MLQTPYKKRRQKKSLLGKARWAGYAAAGAATMLGGQEVAEAGIVPGYLGVKLDQCHPTSATYSFRWNVDGVGQEDLVFVHLANSKATSSGFAMAGGTNGGAIVGQDFAGFGYASKLGTSVTVDSGLNFLPNTLMWMAFYSGASYSQFADPGIGYLGFSFEADDGTHYGWLKVEMTGAPHNAYTLLDFAYEDVAGRGIHINPVPEPGSLGLLATGAVGLLLWRRARRNKKSAS